MQNTPEQIAGRIQYGQGLQQQAASGAPVQGTGWLQALAHGLEGGFGGYGQFSAEQDRLAEQQRNAAMVNALLESGQAPTLADVAKISQDPWTSAGTSALLASQIPKPPEDFTLAPDAVRFGGTTNKELARGLPKKPDTAITVENVGNIPPGYELYKDPVTGATQMRLIPGSPAAKAAEEEAKGKVTKGNLVVDEIDRAQEVLTGGGWNPTGMGSLLAPIPGTNAQKLAQNLATIKANIGFAALTQMRKESPTGAALGNVTVQEVERLEKIAGSLEQSQDAGELSDNLNRLWNATQDVIHGPGAGPPRRTLKYEERQKEREAGAIPEAPDGVDPRVWPEVWKNMTPEQQRLWPRP